MQSTSQLFTDLLESMNPEEFEITVICGYPALSFVEEGESVSRRETHNGIEIIRCGLHFNYKRNLLLRAVYYLAYLLSASARVLKHSRDSLVCAVTNPPFAPVWVWLLSLIGKFRYQIVCHDIFPDGLVAVGGMKADGVLASVWRLGNRSAYAAAEDVVVLGRDMGNLVRDRYEVAEQRIQYIPNWSVIEPTEVISAEETELWKRLDLDGKFVVQYSGNMGLWHDMETLVRAADLLKKHEGVHFLFIGDGRRKQSAQALAQKLDLKNITWLPFQPKELLTDSLACSHLSLISQREGLNGVAVPCKIYGILSVGRAILAQVPPGCEIDLVVAEENCGVRVAPGDEQGVANEILRLSRECGVVEEMGKNARAAFQAKYRLANATESFRRLWSEG